MALSRYDFLETLARIKVTKIAAFRDVRFPCRNKDLEGMHVVGVDPMVDLKALFSLLFR